MKIYFTYLNRLDPAHISYALEYAIDDYKGIRNIQNNLSKLNGYIELDENTDPPGFSSTWSKTEDGKKTHEFIHDSLTPKK